MIVADASAVVSSLLNDSEARRRLATEAIHVPHLVDVEIAEALRKLVLRGEVNDADAQVAIGSWQRLGVRRYAANSLLNRVWQLRHNVSAYDAAYVALAETLSCPLLTADKRLAAATGVRCPVEVAPR